MRLALLLLALPAFGQACVEIHFSRQADEVVKALVGTVPKTVSVYRADVVNTCPVEARFFPSRVGFEAALTAPMQDPEAALFAAQNYKETRWWAVAAKAGATLAPYGGAVLLGLQAFGVQIPDAASSITAGLNGSTALFNSFHKEATRLNVPATWLRDGLPEIILKPGEPVPYLLALGGNPGATFTARVGSVSLAAGSKPASPSGPCGSQQLLWADCGVSPRSTDSAYFLPKEAMSVSSHAAPDAPIVTHPMVDEPAIYDTARIAAMIQERSAARGAVE